MDHSPIARPPGHTGEELTIVKLRPDGSRAAEYPGILVSCSDDWMVTRATWTFQRMEFDYMTFAPGDILYEYFATRELFNAFALFSPEHSFKGWYSNIAYPATIQNQTIVWHDLFVDVIQQPDGTILVLDEDELLDSGLHKTDPALYGRITVARDTVVEKMRSGDYPFSEVELPRR